MRSKLLIVLFAAAAFLCASFAVTREASAASVVSSRAPHANLAQPGTYAAKFGAPLCDDRAASAYAAEPKPAAVDGGEVAASASSGEECRAATGALFEARSDAGAPQRDDLQRTPPVAHDLAILPGSIEVPSVVALVAMPRAEAEDGAREGFGPHDNPPPRPIPWRS